MSAAAFPVEISFFWNSCGTLASNPVEDRNMANTANRLELYGAILALIEQKRAETGDEFLGASIERVVIDTQFQEIENEILEDPGPIEPWLLRRRRGEV